MDFLISTKEGPFGLAGAGLRGEGLKEGVAPPPPAPSPQSAPDLSYETQNLLTNKFFA